MKKCALALGTFDGLHKGHKKVLEAAIRDDYCSVAVTFTSPPKGAKMLLTSDEKNKYIKNMGYSEVETLDFDKVKKWSAEYFLNYLDEKYKPHLISCGFNYRFGNAAKGDIYFLKEFCENRGISFLVAEEEKINGETVSSTAIRKYIESGEMQKAKSLLGRAYSFTSPVIEGDKRGRTFGFPTINQIFANELSVPKLGVYAVKVKADGKIYDGVCNIGHRPTYHTDSILAETNILDFDGDLYKKEVTICFESFMRSEKKFSGRAELILAIKNDTLKAQKYFEGERNL